jgi:hypothetical protein
MGKNHSGYDADLLSPELVGCCPSCFRSCSMLTSCCSRWRLRKSARLQAASRDYASRMQRFGERGFLTGFGRGS